MSKSQAQPSRRGFVLGAAAATAATAAVVSLPTSSVAPEAPTVEHPKPEKGGGYRLSEHVKQYYQTTRV
jgi:hypothetical protein